MTGSQDRISRAGGAYEQGDLLVDKISATYTRTKTTALKPAANLAYYES